MSQAAEVVAISVDPPSESRKTDELLGKAFPLLGDPDLRVIKPYGMEHDMGGGDIIGNMGYAIVNAKGVLQEAKVDPLFGQHADRILQSLQAAR